MDAVDEDILVLFSRRAVKIAACTSFENKYATTKGGQHIVNVTDLVSAHFRRMLKEKYGKKMKPKTIRKHVWVFVNCSMTSSRF